MKCKYCGKKTAGSAAYCSAYCREKGEAREQFGRNTRLPFIISLLLAVVAAAAGAVLIAAGRHDQGFLFLSGGLALAGIGMLAFPRSGKGANAFCHVGGALSFALAVAIFLLWR